MPGSQNVVIHGRDANGDAVPILGDSLGQPIVVLTANTTSPSAGNLTQSSSFTWWTQTGDALLLYNLVTTNSGTTSTNNDLDQPVGASLALSTAGSASATARATTDRNFKLGFGPARFRHDISVSALSDATDTYNVVAGLSDITFGSASSASDEAVFTYTHSTNGGNWVCRSRNLLGTVETTNTAVAPTTGSTRQTLEILVNADATEVTFYIDGVLVATHTEVPSINLGHGLGILKSAGTNARLLNLMGSGWDYVFTTPL